MFKKLFKRKPNKPNNSDKVFSQWIEFVKEDEQATWLNPRFKNSY